MLRSFLIALLLSCITNSAFADTSFIINGVPMATDPNTPNEDRKIIADADEEGWRWYEDRALGFHQAVRP